ncbi:MAG: histidine kinase dimerization/phosphoacceptor domain-containing protein [Bacteroidetes bacterium]|nr:histidine kinase dimerization/phosphoacceptor domain-containing protein [Bacteroidota bacterium]
MDNVGQKLTLASIYTSQLAHANFHPDIQTQLHSIGEIINDSLTELRSLSKSITNEAIDSAELFSILKNECAKVNALQICQVNFIETEEPFVVSAVQKKILYNAYCKSLYTTV